MSLSARVSPTLLLLLLLPLLLPLPLLLLVPLLLSHPQRAPGEKTAAGAGALPQPAVLAPAGAQPEPTCSQWAQGIVSGGCWPAPAPGIWEGAHLGCANGQSGVYCLGPMHDKELSPITGALPPGFPDLQACSE
jgi:hypothetical protein